MKSHERSLRIEWGDCDPAGIVYYPRYFEMFDAGTTHLIEAAAGLRKRDLLAQHGLLGWPMVDTRASFSRPLRFGDEATLESRFVELGRSSFKIIHRLLKDGELAVEGWETRVLVREEAGRLGATPIPDNLAAQFKTP